MYRQKIVRIGKVTENVEMDGQRLESLEKSWRMLR